MAPDTKTSTILSGICLLLERIQNVYFFFVVQIHKKCFLRNLIGTNFGVISNNFKFEGHVPGYGMLYDSILSSFRKLFSECSAYCPSANFYNQGTQNVSLWVLLSHLFKIALKIIIFMLPKFNIQYSTEKKLNCTLFE